MRGRQSAMLMRDAAFARRAPERQMNDMCLLAAHTASGN